MAVTQLVFQIVHDLLDGCVYKICIVRICSIFYFLVDLLDPGVHVISQRFLVLILIDISLFQHVFQHLCPALLVLLRVRDGVQAGGALGDACDTRGFRQRQLRNGLTEIAVGCRLYTQGILAQVDGIQIIFQDLLLVHDLRQL